MKTTIKVKKEDYEVYNFISRYFGICKKGKFGGDCIYGGDSACEDHYNQELINTIFENWDGVLTYTGERYGYRIEL